MLYLLLGKRYRYLLQSSAIGQISAQIANRPHTSTAVFATIGLNFLNYGSSAVARGTS